MTDRAVAILTNAATTRRHSASTVTWPGRLTAGASAAREEAKPTNESAARRVLGRAYGEHLISMRRSDGPDELRGNSTTSIECIGSGLIQRTSDEPS